KEFFREAQGLLNPDGVFVIGTVSTPGLRGRSIANRNATIYHTLSRVFSVVLPVGDRFLFYIATDAPQQITADAGILQRRFLERNIRTEGFSRHHFHILLEESQLRRVNWIIRNHGRSIDAHLTSPQTGPLLPASVVQQQENEHLLPPVQERFFINSDFRPIGYYYTLMFWNDLTGYGRTEVFDWLLQIRPWWLLPAAGLLFVAAGLLRITDHIGGGRRSVFNAVIVAAFMTGFSTMTLQIALLFSFQSVYGFVYEMAGLIVAIFMGGLAAGAAFTHRYITNKANTNTLAAVQLLAAVLACLIAVVLPRAAAVESLNAVFLLFSLLTFVSGLLNGVSFPLTAECCMALNHRAERSAGSVYAVELFGGCLGAAIASAAVVPVLGIVACCLSAAAASAAAFVVLLISRRSYA
ncbi:MAG TPA: hypothetical protein VLH60_04495, partial [Sedimentisphaerales bacterium]|nr:hypothetical protein [Sedimentisphaerales bacterium]